MDVSGEEVTYFEVVKGDKFNRNKIFTSGKSILDVNLFGEEEMEAYVSSFMYTYEVKEYVSRTGRIRSYVGPVLTDFLYWDFDDNDDISLAFEDTRELIENLEGAGVPTESILVTYSGQKGLHVILPSADMQKLGARTDMHLISKGVAMYFAGELGTADDIIYIRTGIFRAINSKHPKTGKFCIPLTVEEFLGNSIECIQEMASTQKQVPKDWNKTPVAVRSIDLAIKNAIVNMGNSENKGIGKQGFSSIVSGIMGGFPDGEWNRGFTSVAGILHSHGIDNEMTYAILHTMNNSGENPMPPSDLSTIVSSVDKYEIKAEFREPEGEEICTFKEGCDAWVEMKQNYKEIFTGFKYLDERLFNFDEGKMLLVAAYSRVGKTAFGLHIAKNIAKNDGDYGLFCSLEMSKASLFYRASVIEASKEGLMQTAKAHTDMLLTNEKYRNAVCDKWKSLRIVDKASQTTQQISQYQTLAEEKAERQGRKSKVLLVDYMELVGNTDDVKKLSQAAREIKNIAKTHNIRVILLAQLNRNNGDEYDEPSTNSVKGSGEIFNAADNVLFLWKSRDHKNRIHVKDDKNRDDIDGLRFDLIQTGLAYQEAPYQADANGNGEFWGT